jgi:GNAT superfamily N-acetyltransferase
MVSVTVRRATAADSLAIRSLEVRITGADRQNTIIAESIAAGGCLVACDGSAYAGFATWDRGFFDRPFVRLLGVAPGFRRRGIARALLIAIEDAARSSGELFISTEQINVAMQSLLASLAYVPSGALDFVNEPGNLELVYWKRLQGRNAPPPV